MLRSLSAHDYPAPIARILSEALTLTALLGAMLKEVSGQLTLQAQTEEGIIDLLVCDYKGGELRGYVRFDDARLSELASLPSLFALFGKGYLAITFDQAMTRRYRACPLEGGSWRAAKHIAASPNRYQHGIARRRSGCCGGSSSTMPEGEEAERLDTGRTTRMGNVRILPSGPRTSCSIRPAVETLLCACFLREEVGLRVVLANGCRCSRRLFRDVIPRSAGRALRHG